MITNSFPKPIFIFGSQKSGSSLLRSLLDGHPDLFVIPSETHYFQMTGHYVDFRMRRSRFRNLTIEEKISSLQSYIAHENASNDPHGAVIMQNKYNEDTFNQALATSQPKTDRQLMMSYVAAIHESLSGTELPPTIRVVEKSIEHAEFAPLLQRWFPDAYFVHIIRNPYATLVSSRNTSWQRGYPFLGLYLESLRNNYGNFFKNKELLERYHVIRYEDLIENTPRTMSSLAEFLDIKSGDYLLTPTLLGAPWTGNSTSNVRFEGVNKAPSNSWRQSITDLEIILVNKIASEIIEYFEYEKLSPQHHPWRQKLPPARGESLKAYLLNRALLWAL